ncbi:PQQ-binding-like beta-propeller repeat protein [Streptomyces sp. AS02]|uniref:outer membrane protein assembly factor BamB family protein n=1 Tax=Streptomyces sp. AS02 TaxID=2938946 RepID=UPI002020ADA1|nr:PQQ-binding-like beta-propeller repeat protein [Streptomyces sp. AS02]MCL8014896.1 PQQ-binding-like beta-propeller repeat protein [Streptomyces sp. AS02]
MTTVERRNVIKGAAATAAGLALAQGAAGQAQAQTPTGPQGTGRGTANPCSDDPLAPADENFPKVGGNYGNQNYSRLGAITLGNVKRLGGAWVNRVEGGDTGGNSQSSGVFVDGTLFVESSFGNVHAVDGRTGVTKWTYTQTRGTLTRRGVAVGQGLVFTHGGGNHVIALDQETGAVVWERQVSGYGNIGKVAITYHDGLLHCGTTDGSRGAAVALRADNGDHVWHFWGTPEPGEFGNDTWEGDTWQQGGATPWMHPAIDPGLGLVYWTFGNARGALGAQDGSDRDGQNLFANSIVALDLKTGAYRWHFQSVHHDIWDLDNVMAPVLLDTKIKGRTRKLVVYGSKTGTYFMLDRRDGTAPLGIDEVRVPQEIRQKTWPTQPMPRQGGWMTHEVVWQPLGTAVPGARNRAVPGYRFGPLFTPHWDDPVLTMPGQGGGADWSAQSYSHKTGLVYTGYGYALVSHARSGEGNVGRRLPGSYLTGGIVAVDPSTNEVAWRKLMPYSLAHGNGILNTASGVMFIGQPDGHLLALDARDGKELWRFQTGAAISSSPLTYEIDGVQYVAVFAGGTGLPYGNSAPRGDFLWAFRLGGTVPEAETPEPPEVRRPVTGTPVEGGGVHNTVILARTYNAATGTVGTTESTAENAMAPNYLRVPVGTTVTFTNPADNAHTHGATQFFEGLFDLRLAPGESATHTFTAKGAYYFNDTYHPRPTGMIEVY